jgi:2-deoxy-D-gluconate 3-dehydrogenase
MKPLAELINLSGKAAIVTGGAKGIGQGVAARLAEAGAKVLIADLDSDAAHRATEELTAKGWTAGAYVLDVSNEDQVAAMINHCREQFGSVDILVNNAGIYPPAPIAKMTAEQFEKVMHVNLRSAFLTTKHAAEVMKEQGGGRIINITSIDALHPSMIGLAHYDASKHGLWGFTKNSALELAAHKIWVNAIAPGGIATPGVAAMSQGEPSIDAEAQRKQTEAFMAKIPMHRMGEPDEIGSVGLCLASDMSNYMTCSQIGVDGGAVLS